MTFDDLVRELRATGIPFEEDEWVRAHALKTDYGVYSLDGGADLAGDDIHCERMCEGTVDLFTRGVGRKQAAKVEQALTIAGVGWRINSKQVESATGYTHREWVFRCLP